MGVDAPDSVCELKAAEVAMKDVTEIATVRTPCIKHPRSLFHVTRIYFFLLSSL